MCRVTKELESGEGQTVYKGLGDAPSSSATEPQENTMKSSNGKPVGIDVLSGPMQFALLGTGVFFFFGIHNILQEAMMKVPGFNYGVMLGYMEVIG